MAEVWINGGGLIQGADKPGFAAIEDSDGLSSDIPNLPTQEEQTIDEEDRKAEEEEKKEQQEQKKEDQA